MLSSRAEIERVRNSLVLTTEFLTGKILLDLISGSELKMAHLAIRLPAIITRIKRLIGACETMLQQFSATESRLVATMALEAGTISGLIRESPVAASQIRQVSNGIAPPTIQDMAARMKQLENYGSAIVRIEKYASGVIVYLPGTKTGSLGWTNNPMDMKANLQEFVGQPSNLQGGVIMELKAAGVTANDRVMLVGHSQGGLAAMSMAEESSSGSFPYKVVNVVTFGSPVGQKNVNSEVNVLSLENDSDLVPKLDGRGNPTTPNWLTLRSKSIGDPISVHLMESYQRNSLQMQLSASQTHYVKLFEDFTSGPGDVYLFELTQGPIYPGPS